MIDYEGGYLPPFPFLKKKLLEWILMCIFRSLNQSIMDNYNKANKRKEMLSQGAYDGRFRQRMVKDKKKEQSRKWARGKNNW